MKLWKLPLYLCLLGLCFACDKDDEATLTPTLLPYDSVLDPSSEYILILGDVQYYTCHTKNEPYFEATINWIYSQYQYGAKIKYVLQTGDITEQNRPSQYKVYQKYIGLITDYLPVIACTGNHDYTWDDDSMIPDRFSTLFTEYVAPYAQNWTIESYFEPGQLENVIISGELHQLPYDILCLEFATRTEVLEWANNYVSSHLNRNFILLTHEFINTSGVRLNENAWATRMLNTSYNTPEQVWQNLVKDNDNILCVICGHSGFAQYLFSTNSAGREVPQILHNIQSEDNGGNGWIQLWEIPAEGDSIHVQTYNTISRSFSSDPKAELKFKYK